MPPLLLRQSMVLLAAVSALIAGGCKKDEVKPDDSPAAQSAPAVTAPAAAVTYTCCNFHYNGDWINDGNYAQLPMIPAGTPIKLKSIDHYIAYVDIDGKKYRLGLDYGRTAETTEQWANKLIVKDDPKARLAAWSPSVRKAIQGGQIMLGMSKDQVIMALGYPMTSENPRLDAPYWRYWWSSWGEYKVHWNGVGRVREVTGHPETVANMLAQGYAAPEPAPASATPAVKTTTTKPGSTKKGVTKDAKSK
jgi:outer membrane protein assembly factor BamE (lipoprotein component of BamABCDE complex)